MIDIALHRRLMRKRVVPKFIAARENLKLAQQILLAMDQMETPTRWQRFCEAWASLGSR